MKKKKDKTDPQGSSGRKQYVYFENLRFLETVSKQTTSSNDEELVMNTGLDNENEKVQKIRKNIEKNDVDIEHCIVGQCRKRPNTEVDELVQDPKKNNIQCRETSSENDEDRLFLLSLVSELHRVPADRKLILKMEIIGSIYKAQQTSSGNNTGDTKDPLHTCCTSSDFQE